MGDDIGAKLDEIINMLKDYNPDGLSFTGTFRYNKNNNNVGDDTSQNIVQCPEGYQIAKLVYTTSGFSTDMYYTISVGGTTITSEQDRSNVTNFEADLSSVADKTSLSTYARRYGEGGIGTGQIIYTISLEKI